ncbi:MAG: thiamine phosphate synthase [Alphaproteobacteria bacterium]|jgi:thiamine-phosphate pyrophosphorylase|nr:thiamine phosphate synthase [Alphaproteobacteria bacterium]MDP6517484.1 thiamine phosphate synthase [Alphaproteobacteria bacterium]
MTLAKRARQLNLRFPARHLPALLMLTDRERIPDPLAAARLLPPASAVVLRDYDARDRLALAHRLARLCRRRRLLLLIGADAGLAARLAADGLHLPEALGLSARRWRRARPRWLITVAAHSEAALWRAWRSGAHAAVLSPVFATASHPGARPLGAVRLAALTRRAPLPVYALGGIDSTSARRLAGTGVHGLAAIGGLADPAPRGRR